MYYLMLRTRTTEGCRWQNQQCLLKGEQNRLSKAQVVDAAAELLATSADSPAERLIKTTSF